MAPSSPTPTMPALLFREESDPKAKPYSFSCPMLGNSLTAVATWSAPMDMEPRTGQPANLPPEGCLSLLTWSLIFFHVFGFSHVFKHGQKEKIVFS